MKRFLTTFFFAIIALSTWAYDVKIDGIYYNLNSSTKEAEVTYLSENDYSNRYAYSGEIVIPETITFKNTEIKVTSIGDYAFQECYDLTSVTIPNSVTSIGDYAFDECTSLTSVTIPNSVASIGCWAFGHCTGLTSVTIPNSVTSIGDYAFAWCSDLTSVTIPNSVTSIGYAAFCGCTGLTSVTIPNSVTSIGVNPFGGCSGLTSIIVEQGNTVYDSRNNCYAIIETASNTLISGCMNTIIPNSVTSIGICAFDGCSGLTSVTIPNSVTSIGDGAFCGCTGLISVTIPNSVTSIGLEAFSDCSGLTSIIVEQGNTVYDSRNNCYAIIETVSNTLISGCMNTIIPNSVTSIGVCAFEYCSGLTSVTIPNSVTSIGSSAFEGCSGLTSVEIPNSVTSIGECAFWGCSGLTSVTIPNSVSSIGNHAFSWCTGLTFVTIPNSVTSIGYKTFSSCYGLTSVTIGNSVTSIGDLAFASCKNLAEVTCKATIVPSTESDAFKGSYIEFATLIVPEESLDAYKSTAPWSGFGTFKTIEGGEVPETKKCEKPTIAYENKHLIYSSATEGAQVVAKIECADVKTTYDNDVELTATYNITAYATKAGMEDSDVATATLVWATGTLETEDINEVKSFSVDALPLLISQDNGIVTISGLQNGDVITVYTTNGTEVTKSQASGSATLLNLIELQGKVAILSINGKSAKIMIK